MKNRTKAYICIVAAYIGLWVGDWWIVGGNYHLFTPWIRVGLTATGCLTLALLLSGALVWWDGDEP